MTWQKELEEGRDLDAAKELPRLPEREPVKGFFDEHGVLAGSIPSGSDGVIAIRQKRLS